MIVRKVVVLLNTVGWLIDKITMAVATRAPNFTVSEKSVFVDLLLQFPIITSSKSLTLSDKEQKRKKQEAWKNLANNFNACGVSDVTRDVPKLQKLWKNIKADVKKYRAVVSKEQRKTGGGVPDIPKDAPVMEQVYAKIISRLFSTVMGQGS